MESMTTADEKCLLLDGQNDLICFLTVTTRHGTRISSLDGAESFWMGHLVGKINTIMHRVGHDSCLIHKCLQYIALKTHHLCLCA